MNFRCSRLFTAVMMSAALVMLTILNGHAQRLFDNNPKVSDDKHWDNSFGAANSPNGPVYAIFVKDSSIYIGGSFTMAGSINANSIARWDGHQWYALGEGVGGGSGPLAPTVYAITVDNNNHVFAGGNFISAGSMLASNIAMWDGSSWTSLDSGMNAEVKALAVGSAGEIYAGGLFTASGTMPLMHIAQWNGTDWTDVGGGISGSTVNSIAIKGTTVAAAGNFDYAGATTAQNIALWDGSVWSAAGSGTDSTINSITFKGNDLYSGGYFLHSGGVATNYFSKYLTGTWSAIGAGLDYPPACIGYNQTDVFALSSITGAGAYNITKYDCCWDPLGSGLDTVAYALCVNGNDVWAGGPFVQAGGKPSIHFAHWNVTKDFSAGIQEHASAKREIYLFPNPAKETLNINAGNLQQGRYRLEIFSSIGCIVHTAEVEKRSAFFTFEVDVRGLQSGVYTIRLSSEQYTAINRFIVE
ncbi:MAG: T9SS type A sorting domain-containing protein [Bacteroidota bacterium]